MRMRTHPGAQLRMVVSIAAIVVAMTGCGDSGVFEGLGDRSHEYVRGSTTTTIIGAAEVTTTVPDGLPVEQVSWFNQGIEGETVGDVNIVVSAVWARGRSEGRFIQASPAEIAEALPGVQFPSTVPQNSQWVTSQLVYDAASATLDSDISAAFGLWAVEPYSEGEGRLAVLRVGQALIGSELGSAPVASPGDDGLTLMWSDGLYRYELACRNPVPEEQCWQMVESTLPLEVVGPGPQVVNS